MDVLECVVYPNLTLRVVVAIIILFAMQITQIARDYNLYLRGVEEINAAFHQHVEGTRQLRFTESGSESTARIPPLQSAYP